MLYYESPRFITGMKALTHRCELYARVGWPSLSTRRLQHWLIFIYKAIFGLPSYLQTFISINSTGNYNLRSQDLFLLSVPKVRTELGKKKSFKFAAPSAWNNLQKFMKLTELVSLVAVKMLLIDTEAATSADVLPNVFLGLWLT